MMVDESTPYRIDQRWKSLLRTPLSLLEEVNDGGEERMITRESLFLVGVSACVERQTVSICRKDGILVA